jgi:hypothetical protein
MMGTMPRRPAVALILLVLGGCGDAGQVIGHYTGPPVFQAPTVMAELSVADAKDQDPTLTADLLEIYFFSERAGLADLYTSRRASLDDPWEDPTSVTELNSAEEEINPAVSGDGLRIWFYSRREPMGIWRSVRRSRDNPWEAPVAAADLAVADAGVIAPGPSSDELRMAVSVQSDREDDRDVYEATRASPADPWGTLHPIAGLNGPADDSTPFLVGDGRVILMSSSRAGNGDLFWARRATLEEGVDTPQPLDALNDPEAFESHPHLSPDGTRIFFGSARSGSTDLYEAQVAVP